MPPVWALMLSGLEKAIIVSMGTGTAIVSADGSGGAPSSAAPAWAAAHCLGCPTGCSTYAALTRLSRHPGRQTLACGPVCQRDNLEKMHPFPKAYGLQLRQAFRPCDAGDIAYGIINLVFQTIGTTAAFASKIENTNKIVLTGRLTNVPAAGEIFKALEPLYNVEYIIPPYAEYATAAGAALCGVK